jgi:predicted component of type VI protein secretion system
MSLRLSATLNGENRQWLLERSPVSLGRASGNAIQVLDGTVSKEHAELSLTGDRWTIRDLGSRNGTRVNGRDAISALPIAAGDRVEVGHVLLTVSEGLRDDTTRFTTSEHVGSALKLKVSDVLQKPTGAASDTGRVLHVLAEAGQLLVVPRSLDETCRRSSAWSSRRCPRAGS